VAMGSPLSTIITNFFMEGWLRGDCYS
jgi:hypothetical protein